MTFPDQIFVQGNRDPRCVILTPSVDKLQRQNFTWTCELRFYLNWAIRTQGGQLI